jgi:hypothetical protein
VNKQVREQLKSLKPSLIQAEKERKRKEEESHGLFKATIKTLARSDSKRSRIVAFAVFHTYTQARNFLIQEVAKRRADRVPAGGYIQQDPAGEFKKGQGVIVESPIQIKGLLC